MELTLNKKHIDNFWIEKSAKYNNLMHHMESKETWTHSKDIGHYILVLEQSLPQWSTRYIAENTDYLIELLNYLPISYTTYILSWLDQKPDFLLFHIIGEATYIKNPSTAFFMHRLRVIISVGFLTTLFKNNTCSLIKEHFYSETFNKI